MVQTITNKQLYKELDKLGNYHEKYGITLYKDTTYGYFYFEADGLFSESICICHFNQQTPAEWAKLIVTELNKMLNA